MAIPSWGESTIEELERVILWRVEAAVVEVRGKEAAF
jgi:hypothetical protein